MSESIGKRLDEAITAILGQDVPFVLIYEQDGQGGACYNASMAEFLRITGSAIAASPEMGLTLGTTRRSLKPK